MPETRFLIRAAHSHLLTFSVNPQDTYPFEAGQENRKVSGSGPKAKQSKIPGRFSLKKKLSQ